MRAHNAANRLKTLAWLLLILLPISALGSRLQLWPYTIGLALFALSLLGSLIVEVICSIWLLQKPQPDTARPLRWSSLIALPPLIMTAAIMRGHTGGTMLHDISTNTNRPPEFSQAQNLRGNNANTLDYSHEKAEAQLELFPEIKPIVNALSASKNFERSLTVANNLGWEIHHQNPESGYIEAIETTLWFGFKDDIVIHAQNNRVDIRSVSRVGRSDFGANAKRIHAFIDAFSNEP